MSAEEFASVVRQIDDIDEQLCFVIYLYEQEVITRNELRVVLGLKALI